MQNQIIYGILLLSSSLVILNEALIVPQEVPSILSLIYSNIPPIKKGTDSRIGFGYRFGDHADFQVQFELGPQKETQPIGDKSNQPQISKRYVRPSDELKVEREVRRQENKLKYETTTSKGNWIQNWFGQFRDNLIETATEQPIVLRRTPMISSSAYRHLSKLYESAKINLDENEIEIEADETTSTTTTTEPFGSHQLPQAALDILLQNRSGQQQLRKNIDNKSNRSKEKIDSITRDLSNVDLD